MTNDNLTHYVFFDKTLTPKQMAAIIFKDENDKAAEADAKHNKKDDEVGDQG